MLTNKQFIAFLNKALGAPYWYGTFGNVASESLFNSKKAQYPKYYNRSNYTRGWAQDYGKRVCDCIGLWKWFDFTHGNIDIAPVYNSARDVSANGMKSLCKEGGSISTIPELPGVAVFMPGHIGYYIGGGYVIEARGHDYGVVKTKLQGRGWTSWGKIPYIEYSYKADSQPKPEPEKPSTPATPATPAPKLTHKVYADVNVRSGPGVSYKRLNYESYPDYIKSQFSKKNYLPKGVKVHVYKNTKGWYKISPDKEIWIAGNYTSKI